MAPRAHVRPSAPAAERRARRARPDLAEREHLARGLGRVLFAAQVSTGLMTPELAERAQLDPSHLYAIIAGTKRPSDCALLRLARALREPDRDAAAALYVELIEVGCESVYRSPMWRPRLSWRRRIERACAERAKAGSQATGAPGGPYTRTTARSAVSGPLSAPGAAAVIVRSEAIREALAAARRLP